MSPPDLKDDFIRGHTILLCDSYRHWTGKPLLPDIHDDDLPEALFTAPFVIVSHNTDAVPHFNYGNRRALELFELDWATFTQTPSTQSADRQNQSARTQLMTRVKQEGCLDNCSGERISASGRRFHIENAVVWNVTDEEGVYHGQAAMFDRWNYL